MSDPTPAEIEVTTDKVEVTYEGQTYVFPSSLEKTPGDVLEAIDNEKISVALRALLGPAQWTTFKATKPLFRDYPQLMDAYFVAIGLGSTGE